MARRSNRKHSPFLRWLCHVVRASKRSRHPPGSPAKLRLMAIRAKLGLRLTRRDEPAEKPQKLSPNQRYGDPPPHAKTQAS